MRTIAHLSDLHFGRTDPNLLEPLRRCLFEVAPDLVVVSGDLTQRARAAQFREARAYLDTLPKPQLIVPGNHDVPLYNVFARFVRPLAGYKRIVSDDLEPSYVDDEIAVIGVNTARSLVFKGGRINQKQAERVRRAICDLGEEVTKIVVSHHPFDVPKGSHEEDQIVGRARMALETLAGCGADLFLAGHLHASHVGHTAERYGIAGISALVVQAGTALSTRGRGESNSFNLLRVSPQHIDIDRYSYEDSAFHRASTQGFDHDGGGWTASA
jgi:3',5'-cyclic AMP phosphodiesterase CpdA